MGRPPSDLDECLDWQERLESFQASGLEIDVFCLKEGVSRSTFYRWVDRLKDGIPESMIAEKEARGRVESAEGAAFVPISLKAAPGEIELPNGGIVRLPLGRRSGGVGGSHPSCRRVTPLEGTQVMMNFQIQSNSASVRVFLVLTAIQTFKECFCFA